MFWHRSLLECFGVKPGAWAVNGGWGETLYEMAWTDWYMVYGGIVLVGSTWGRYVCFLPLQLFYTKCTHGGIYDTDSSFEH